MHVNPNGAEAQNRHYCILLLFLLGGRKSVDRTVERLNKWWNRAFGVKITHEQELP
jgi:hypothetical protein